MRAIYASQRVKLCLLANIRPVAPLLFLVKVPFLIYFFLNAERGVVI